MKHGRALELGRWALLALVVLVAVCRDDDVPSRPSSGGEARAPDTEPTSSDARTALTFSQAKTRLRAIYADHQIDIYCACAFNDQLRVDPTECGYTPRGTSTRGERIEWEHMMPAWFFGHDLACWTGSPCANSTGRACCSRSEQSGGDADFRAAEGDMHNLVPAVGQLNGDRSNHPFGEVAGEPREYGLCDFEMDRTPNAQIAEPPDELRGDVARAWLYTVDEHSVTVPDELMDVMRAWHAADPPDDWERTRDDRIAAEQGNHNPYVTATQ